MKYQDRRAEISQPLADAQRLRDIEQWSIDFRFVREIERLEREGLIRSRTEVELAILMPKWGIARLRNGTMSASPVHITRLWKQYHADISFILTGKRIAAPPGSALDPGEKRGPSVWYEYRETARFRIGPRGETHASYYPADPRNTKWTPTPAGKSIRDYEPEPHKEPQPEPLLGNGLDSEQPAGQAEESPAPEGI